jgi:hypothetical protein
MESDLESKLNEILSALAKEDDKLKSLEENFKSSDDKNKMMYEHFIRDMFRYVDLHIETINFNIESLTHDLATLTEQLKSQNRDQHMINQSMNSILSKFLIAVRDDNINIIDGCIEDISKENT